METPGVLSGEQYAAPGSHSAETKDWRRDSDVAEIFVSNNKENRQVFAPLTRQIMIKEAQTAGATDISTLFNGNQTQNSGRQNIDSQCTVGPTEQICMNTVRAEYSVGFKVGTGAPAPWTLVPDGWNGTANPTPVAGMTYISASPDLDDQPGITDAGLTIPKYAYHAQMWDLKWTVYGGAIVDTSFYSEAKEQGNYLQGVLVDAYMNTAYRHRTCTDLLNDYTATMPDILGNKPLNTLVKSDEFVACTEYIHHQLNKDNNPLFECLSNPLNGTHFYPAGMSMTLNMQLRKSFEERMYSGYMVRIWAYDAGQSKYVKGTVDTKMYLNFGSCIIKFFATEEPPLLLNIDRNVPVIGPPALVGTYTDSSDTTYTQKCVYRQALPDWTVQYTNIIPGTRSTDISLNINNNDTLPSVLLFAIVDLEAYDMAALCNKNRNLTQWAVGASNGGPEIARITINTSAGAANQPLMLKMFLNNTFDGISKFDVKTMRDVLLASLCTTPPAPTYRMSPYELTLKSNIETRNTVFGNLYKNMYGFRVDVNTALVKDASFGTNCSQLTAKILYNRPVTENNLQILYLGYWDQQVGFDITAIDKVNNNSLVPQFNVNQRLTGIAMTSQSGGEYVKRT